MIQQNIRIYAKRFRNYLGFTKNYLIRKNPILMLLNEVEVILKDVLLLNRKKKMAHYRLSYQIHKLNEMETLIAKNNEHTFLKGKKFNTLR